TEHLLGGPAGDAARSGGPGLAASASADRRAASARAVDRADANREGGRAEPVDRGRLDPGQDRTRPSYARVRRRVPRVRLRPAQGLPGAPAPGRAGHTWPMPDPPAFFRAGAPGERRGAEQLSLLCDQLLFSRLLQRVEELADEVSFLGAVGLRDDPVDQI